MKQTVRVNTFETNSSSTHSFTYTNEYDQILSLIDDASCLLRDLYSNDDAYKALVKLQLACNILIDQLRNPNFGKDSDYD